MKRIFSPIILAVIITACGCGSMGPGTKRTIGPMEFDQAFASAANVFAQYFTIDEADMFTGKITSKPEHINGETEQIIGANQMRRIGTLNMYRKDGDVVASVLVEVQKLQPDMIHHDTWEGAKYDTVPNQSPAEIEAATTPQQNRNWQTVRRDRRMEHAILTDIYNRLNADKQK